MTTSGNDGRCDDVGSASIELVILFPALLLLVTALSSTGCGSTPAPWRWPPPRKASPVARAYGSDPDAGQDTALTFVREHGADTLTEAVAIAIRAATGHVQVIVTGRSLSVLPGAPGIAVTQSADGPVERFTTAG